VLPVLASFKRQINGNPTTGLKYRSGARLGRTILGSQRAWILRGDITKAKLISLEERMIRTVISLDEESKRWLDQQARKENVSTAELIRTAVRKYRAEKKRAALPLNDLLKQTSGIWKAGDGLTYQRRLRKEWQK